ncbi:alpha/beta hydrolase [Mariniflexile litorale]|uniref:Alpha/beta hydrolase n=1 Tax=Mariniflexile litorale TaxID=3045158 RepID=A0AAU7EGJ6_9FLAO|nr:alpha/beta hydrolase [Mariniflexile sp. KMM 9835]MDQ8211930.1 alpha/beta hydrolase [Mariniflexile sp. KMM 9835]
MKKNFIYFFTFLFSLWIGAQNIDYKRSNAISYSDLTTESVSEYQKKKCLLDIYYPKNKENVPTIVWFHGGGLTGGTREIPEALKNKGYIIVGVGYRLSPNVTAEVCISDAAAAIAWIFKNIKNYNGDPNSIFISGHSAGGYLALMAVMKQELLQKHKIEANKVAGLVPFSGHTITHFTIRAERGISGEQPIVDEFAPLFYVRKNAPPTLLITGDRELEMLGRYEENAYFYRMMKVSGHEDITLYEMDGYGHNMADPAYPLLLNFVANKTKKRD